MESESDDSSYPCSSCNADVGDDGVQCSVCKGWLHPTCLLKTAVAATTKLPSKPPQWYNEFLSSNLIQVRCSACSQRSTQDASRAEQLSPEVKSRFDTMEAKIESLVQLLNPLLGIQAEPPANDRHSTTAAVTTKRSYRDIAAKNIPARLATVADLHAVHKDDLDSRSIVMLGLPERGEDSADIENVFKVIDQSARAVEYFRMGVSQQNSTGISKPRLLKVILPSSSVVRSVLLNATKLKSSGFSGVYIRRSMPSQDRALLRQLTSKMKEFNIAAREAGSRSKFVIVNEKMLKYDNCDVLEGGRLGRGSLDKSFSFIPSVENSVEVINVHNAVQGDKGARGNRLGGNPKN